MRPTDPLVLFGLMLMFLMFAWAVDRLYRMGRQPLRQPKPAGTPHLCYRDDCPHRVTCLSIPERFASSGTESRQLVRLLRSEGLNPALIERMKSEAGITSVRDLALTLDDPWQDASFAAHFSLSEDQVRKLGEHAWAMTPGGKQEHAMS